MAKALNAKKKGKNAYKMPDPLPKGEIIEDLSKQKWKLGSSIGKGGFGEIYSAQKVEDSGRDYPFVIKIEPHENGPLFVEMHVYMKIGKPSDVEEYKTKKNLKSLGMPCFYGSGSHTHAQQKYRFIVMKRFHCDLNTILTKNKRVYTVGTVFKLTIQILNVLEYIHENGYVHADIKAANILFDSSRNQAFLVDFGLATKFTTAKVFKPNPKKAHDGTIEYLSRDAHKGVQTRRGDLEILAYNVVEWLGGKLPWKEELTEPEKVHKLKEDNMNDITSFLKTSFGNTTKIPAALSNFLKYLQKLNFDTKPNYDEIKKIFINGVKDSGSKLDGLLELTLSSPTKRKSTSEVTPNIKSKKNTKTSKKTDDAIATSSKDDLNNSESDSLKENMEDKISHKAIGSDKITIRRPAKRNNESEQNESESTPKIKKTVTKRKKIEKVARKIANDDHTNENGNGETYTQAMKDLASKLKKNNTKKASKTKAKTVVQSNDINSNDMNTNGYNAEMQEVSNKRQLRVRKKV